MVMGWLGYISYPTENGEPIVGRRALSVSKTHPTDMGNPPVANMTATCVILKTSQGKQRELYTLYVIQIEIIKWFGHVYN